MHYVVYYYYGSTLHNSSASDIHVSQLGIKTRLHGCTVIVKRRRRNAITRFVVEAKVRRSISCPAVRLRVTTTQHLFVCDLRCPLAKSDIQ